MTVENPPRTPRFRFRLGTLLLVIAVLALLLVVVVQQVQIGRLRRRGDALQKQVNQDAKDKDFLTTLVREFRDRLERSSDARGSKEDPAATQKHR